MRLSGALPGVLGLGLALLLGACASAPVAPGEQGDERTRVAEINTQLGVEYMRQGENEVALRKLERALEADPRYARAHEAMGLLYARIGESAKAEENFRRATALAPEDSSIMNNYGLFLCQQNRREEADALFGRALANPLYATPQLVYTNAGTCARGGGDLDKAEAYYRDALQRDPELGPALYGMAEIHFERARYLPARAYLQRFEAVSDPSPESLWLGVRIERRLGDRDAEASYAVALANRFPDSREAGLLNTVERP